MKKLKLSFVLIALVFFTTFSSFAGKMELTGTPEEHLTGRWKLNTLNVDPSPERIDAITKYFNNYDENGTIEFSKEGEFVFESYGNANDAIQKTGFWMFNDDQTKVIINDPEKGVYIADIVKFTKNFIQIQYSYVDKEAISYLLSNYLVRI